MDRDAGTVTVDTSMGDMTLRVPSAMLEDLDQGDRVGVEIRQLGASPAGG